MFKNKKRNENVEATDDVNNAEQAQALANELGRDDESIEKNLEETDPFENIPTFTPGKPGFEEGRTFAGTFCMTKRVYSEKFLAGKKDVDGRKYRDLHVIEDKNGKKFGLWSVGQLGYMFSKTEVGQYVKVRYDGKASEALKQGQSPSHDFTFWTAPTDHRTPADAQNS